MPKKPKQTWFIVEPIPQNTIFMMSFPFPFMVQEWPKRELGGFVKSYFTWYDKDISYMCYVRKEFDAEAEFLSRKMLENPAWALKTISKVENWAGLLIKEGQKFKKLPFSKLTNKQIIQAFQKLVKWHLLAHGVGTSVSWHADCDKERVTKALLAMVKSRIAENKLNLEPAIVFSTLSTPDQESAIKKEEKDLLKLVIKKSGTKVLAAHTKKYEWINYQYRGPILDFKYFADRAQALKDSKIKPQVLLQEILKKERKVKQEKIYLIKKLKFNKHQLLLIKMAQAMVFLKDYRKEAVYYSMYCYEPLFKEMGKRFGMSIDQIRAMNYWEISDLLKTGETDINDLNDRLKLAVGFCDKKNFMMYSGTAATEFLKQTNFEKIKKSTSNEFVGSCAYPGKVRGRVRIINIPEEMHKMNKGDILVAHNTNPNLVPAMKKAAALVSGAGGLTCHTAIVARELQIPSVVGVPGIDQILKDGMRIEVDATAGIIRKL